MSTSEDFRRFMECVAGLEDLQKNGGQFLMEFNQNLELFRRAPVPATSDIMAKIVAFAPSAHLTRYLEAGCLHDDSARLVAFKLDSSLKGLRAYITQARVVLMELETLVKRADESTCLKGDSGLEMTLLSDDYESETEANQQVDEVRWPGRNIRPEDRMQMMSLLFCMLDSDFKMQEMIVNVLSLDSSSESLQGYSLMWTLRPFIEDVVVNQAFTWVKT